MSKRPQNLDDIARDAEDRSHYIAQGIAVDRQDRVTRPPALETKGNSVYVQTYDADVPRVMLDDLNAPLIRTATAAEVEAYAREMVRGMAPVTANIERLIAIANELTLYGRPAQPRATIAAVIDIFRAAEWAEVLLCAILSPGFAALNSWDRETVVRIHGALLIRITGGHLETRR